MELHIVLTLIVLSSSVEGLKLPSYIKACSKSDPKLTECATRQGQAALPHFINGDKKYRIPKLNPLLIEKMIVDQSSGGSVGLKLIAENAYIHGLEKAIIKEVLTDFKQRKLIWTIYVPVAQILMKYKVSGRILVLPITGKGDGNVTLVDPEFTINLDYDLVTKGKPQQIYLKTKNPTIAYTVSRAYIKLDNLFNGNKLLGNQMNKFMDENWKDIVKEIGPTVAEAIGVIANTILSAIADQVPFNEIFKP